MVVHEMSALFTNIPEKNGLQAMEKSLNERTYPEISTELILRLLKLSLKYNFFKIQSKFIQIFQK